MRSAHGSLETEKKRGKGRDSTMSKSKSDSSPAQSRWHGNSFSFGNYLEMFSDFSAGFPKPSSFFLLSRFPPGVAREGKEREDAPPPILAPPFPSPPRVRKSIIELPSFSFLARPFRSTPKHFSLSTNVCGVRKGGERGGWGNNCRSTSDVQGEMLFVFFFCICVAVRDPPSLPSGH